MRMLRILFQAFIYDLQFRGGLFFGLMAWATLIIAVVGAFFWGWTYGQS